jgi:hypothetical protein
LLWGYRARIDPRLTTSANRRDEASFCPAGGNEAPGAGFQGWKGTTNPLSITHRLRPHDRPAAGSVRPADL